MDKEQRKKNWFKRHPWATGIIGLFVLLFILSIFTGQEDTSTEKSTLTEIPSEEAKQPVTKGIFINKTYNELWSVFSPNSKYTDIQKDKIFREEYQGNYVKWTGKVLDVDTSMLNNLRLYVEHRQKDMFDLSGGDITVYMKREQYDRLLELSKGDMVTYVGKFNSYGDFMMVSFSLTDGELW